jgi:hypothetical protein
MAKQKNNFYSAGKALFNAIAGDGRFIVVRPELVKHFGSANVTMLFSRLLFWADVSKGAPFYKFKEPCGHELYREGDSWTEELGLEHRAIKTALDKIGYKKGEASRKKIAADIAKVKGAEATAEDVKREEKSRISEALVTYYTDRDRVTWYEVNMVAVSKVLDRVYLVLPNDNNGSSSGATKSVADLKLQDRELSFITGETTGETTGERTSFNPSFGKDGIEKPFLSKPPHSSLTPADLGTAIDDVLDLGVHRRADKIRELQSRFPVMELVNSFMYEKFTDPRLLVPLWNRLRNRNGTSNLSPRDLFVYAAQAAVCEIEIPGGVAGFLEDHDEEGSSSPVGTRVLAACRSEFRARHKAGLFDSRESMMQYARQKYGDFVAREFVDPMWFLDFEEEAER